MKKYMLKAALLLFLPLLAVSFTSCSDDDDEPRLAGRYQPDAVIDNNKSMLLPTLNLKAEWADQAYKGPALQAMGLTLDWPTLSGLVANLATSYTLGGLDHVELLVDGTIKAAYHELSEKSQMLQPDFEPELSWFPTVADQSVVYYVEGDRINLGVTLKSINAMAGMDVSSMIKEYGFKIKDDRVYIPLKFKEAVKDTYKVSLDGKDVQKEHTTDLYVYVDRGMILPLKDVLKMLIGGIHTEDPTIGAILPALPQFIEDMISKSKTLEIGFRLKKQI